MFQDNPLLAQLKQQIRENIPKKEGVIRASDRGFGFLEVDEKTSYFVPPPYMKKVMHGDRVSALIRTEKEKEVAEPDALLEQAVAWRATNAAAIGQTRAQLDVATAAARRTAANVFAAEAEVTATRFTDAHTAALSRLRLARLADQQATLAQTQAQAANNAATALVGRAGRGLLGVLGGPAGLAIAAGTVAARILPRLIEPWALWPSTRASRCPMPLTNAWPWTL